MEQIYPYLYETHLHTSPVSKCAKASVRENLEFYKAQGYAGVFITNHFIDGNCSYDPESTYEQMIEYFFSDYENAVPIGRELGIDVMFAAESSYKGTDFLIYGLDKEWFLSHPELISLKYSDRLQLMADEGAFIIHAHPYREASYINHIRLFPRHVHGVEVFNACRTELENGMAQHYCESYSLIPFAGSDNHVGEKARVLGGIQSPERIKDVSDFIEKVKRGTAIPFKRVITG